MWPWRWRWPGKGCSCTPSQPDTTALARAHRQCCTGEAHDSGISLHRFAFIRGYAGECLTQANAASKEFFRSQCSLSQHTSVGPVFVDDIILYFEFSTTSAVLPVLQHVSGHSAEGIQSASCNLNISQPSNTAPTTAPRLLWNPLLHGWQSTSHELTSRSRCVHFIPLSPPPAPGRATGLDTEGLSGTFQLHGGVLAPQYNIHTIHTS